jgi:tetratricopeptide (TPR) repeat protein
MGDEKLNKLFGKFELLFQVNSQTPLFVSIALKKFLDDKLDEALSLIETGLKTYPDHPTALLLKAKILTKKANYSQALNLIKRASNLIGCSKTFDYYLSELEVLNKQSVKLEPLEKTEIQDLLKSETISTSSESPEFKLNSESPSSKNIISSDYDVVDDTLIISDTLAKIYFNQKEYKEAMRIYEKLKTKHPEKSAFYDTKILEIKAILDKSQ